MNKSDFINSVKEHYKRHYSFNVYESLKELMQYFEYYRDGMIELQHYSEYTLRQKDFKKALKYYDEKSVEEIKKWMIEIYNKIMGNEVEKASICWVYITTVFVLENFNGRMMIKHD